MSDGRPSGGDPDPAGPLRALAARLRDGLSRLARRRSGGEEDAEPPSADGPGEVGEHRRRILEGAARLEERRAWDVMTPRVDVFAWPASLSLADIAPRLRGVSFSRIPVYGDDIDDVRGVLYVRDAYDALVAGQRDVSLASLAREPLVVPGTLPLTRLLGEFQARRIHMGLVIDEYGGLDGLVTLEDVLEELVGDIVDETDVEEQAIVRVSRGEALVEGSADLREINHQLNVALPVLEHRSLNGWLLDELGRVPRPGETVERDGVRIRVLEATETQVLRARVTRPHVGEAGEEPDGRGAQEDRRG